MSALYFAANSISDSTLEGYLRDLHRYIDYREVKEVLLPELFASFDEFAQRRYVRFTYCNRFEGQYPALRIQCPVGFVPDVIDIEFTHRHESFLVKQAGHACSVQGLANLSSHLRVILTMGLAHWRAT
jgi:hypothetical protein